MTADKSLTTLVYAAAAAVTALTLVYILGPTIFPSSSDSNGKSQIGAVGLANPGNDCFINSVLQALTGSKNIQNYLTGQADAMQADHRHDPDSEDMRDDQYLGDMGNQERLQHGLVTQALHKILLLLRQTAPYRKTLSSKDFVRTLEYAYNRMISRRQQDAQEFLQLVLERLGDEYQYRHASYNVVDGDEKDRHTSNRQEIQRPPFEGSTSSAIECDTCHYKPPATKTAFSMLSLNVPYEYSTTLDACLDGLLKSEAIDGYKCARCAAYLMLEETRRTAARSSSNVRSTNQAAVDAAEFLINNIENGSEHGGTFDSLISKSSPRPERRIHKHNYISTFPPTLILHLSRSLYSASSLSAKNHAKVNFPEVLVLGGFDRKTYRLSSLVTHRGGHDSGHYETFRRQTRPEPQGASAAWDAIATPKIEAASQPQKQKSYSIRNKWWRISDDRVAECKTSEVLDMQRDVYLLFYERIKNFDE